MPEVEWLEIDYPALVRDPGAAIAKLVEFLGQERLPNEKRMANVADPALHRRRRPQAQGGDRA